MPVSLGLAGAVVATNSDCPRATWRDCWPVRNCWFARLWPVMRRFLVIVMMLLLPAQWTWAAAASVCAHEKTESTHVGHHEHAHQGAAAVDEADEGQAGALAEHPDCGACHGMNSAFVPAFGSIPELWMYRSHYEPYASAVPDRFVDTLLRPPLTIVS